jgi:CO/xanthine dehydrogenase FAD-binding subunit
VRLPKFEYFEPQNINEAVSILQNEPAAKILAGGTDLLVNMKHRVERPLVLVNIKYDIPGYGKIARYCTGGFFGGLLSSSGYGDPGREYMPAKPL